MATPMDQSYTFLISPANQKIHPFEIVVYAPSEVAAQKLIESSLTLRAVIKKIGARVKLSMDLDDIRERRRNEPDIPF